jgi:hypothetical protein
MSSKNEGVYLSNPKRSSNREASPWPVQLVPHPTESLMPWRGLLPKVAEASLWRQDQAPPHLLTEKEREVRWEREREQRREGEASRSYLQARTAATGCHGVGDGAGRAPLPPRFDAAADGAHTCTHPGPRQGPPPPCTGPPVLLLVAEIQHGARQAQSGS